MNPHIRFSHFKTNKLPAEKDTFGMCYFITLMSEQIPATQMPFPFPFQNNMK